MYFQICGSSGAGKSTIGPYIQERVDRLVFHDADEHFGEPLSFWIANALEYEAEGLDMLLSTSRPLGELLASPRAIELSTIAGCLMDCDDFTRAARIRARPSPRDQTLGMDILCWACFHRMHADDPRWEQRVIVEDGRPGQWDRWIHWKRGDPRWKVPRFDTSATPIEETADAMAKWIESARMDPPLSRKEEWWKN